MELINAFSVSLQAVWNDSGFSAFTMGNGIMILVGLVLLYLAIVKEFEPLLLGPIAFGCVLANFPRTGFLEDPGRCSPSITASQTKSSRRSSSSASAP